MREDIQIDSLSTNINELKGALTQKLPEGFEKNPQKYFQEYFQNLKNVLNKIYPNIYEGALGLKEGYNLELHTKMVIGVFGKYFLYLRSKLPKKISTEMFLNILSLHDIGKTSRTVQELKERGVKKKIWKEEENRSTKRIIEDVFKKTGIFNDNQKKIILEVIGEGANRMDQLITRKEIKDGVQMTPELMVLYLKGRSIELGLSPEELFSLLEVYLICDAGAYTKESVIDFRNEIGKEKTENILKKYEEGERVQFAGLGVSKWFGYENGKIFFVNNDRFGNHKMKDWIDEVRTLLNKEKN